MLKQVEDRETEILLMELKKVLESGVRGDVVELGCYEGDSSLLFAEALRDFENKRDFGEGEVFGESEAFGEGEGKILWIYDSFEGLPAKGEEDFSEMGRDFREGELAVSKKYVKQRFLKAGLKVPMIKKGWFSELGDEDLPREICFAFLDGDLYESIKDSLALVGDKMADGGVIIVHDYNNEQLPGVTKAVDEWLGGNEGRKFCVKGSLAIIS